MTTRQAWYLMRHLLRIYRRKYERRRDEITWDRQDGEQCMLIVRAYDFPGIIAFQ